MNLGPPPTHAHEEKSPVTKELRGLAFESMADELKNPAGHKQPERIQPQPMVEDAGNKDGNRKQNGRNPQCMAEAIDRVLMTRGILGNPLLAAASA